MLSLDIVSEIDLKKGIDKDNAKKLVQIIKDDKSLKVTPAVSICTHR